MAPIVGDYTTIVGYGESVQIGDGGEAVWEKRFNTGGRWNGGDAWIFVEFGGLVTDPATIQINNEPVGRLKPLHHGDARHTQMVDLPADHLESGDNEIQINAVEHPEAGWGSYDDFVIENMVIFYHQHAE